MASPGFRINGGAVGVKASVSASASVSATLDSTDGVRSVSWSVIGTDETSAVADYTLVTSGSIGQTVTWTAGAAGTAGILRCEINGGLNPQTQQADPATRATAKWYVPTTGGNEVACVNETYESDATYGWTGIVNQGPRAGVTGSVTSVAGSAPIVSSGGATPTISIAAASALAAGSMSAAHYSKLEALSSSPVTAVTGTGAISSTGGTTPQISIAAASGSVPGTMSAAHFTKLTNLPTLAAPKLSPVIAGTALYEAADGEIVTADSDTVTDGVQLPSAFGAAWLVGVVVPTGGATDVLPASGETLMGGGTYSQLPGTSAIYIGDGNGDAKRIDIPSSGGSGDIESVTAGAGLTGGGTSGAVTLDVVANADGSIVVNANDIQVGVVSDAQHGTRGGGTTHSAATTSVAGFMSAADKTKLDGLPSAAVPTTTSVIAGAGMTGGGALSGDVTLNVIANADGSIVANANDIQVGVLASDAQHGNRGGGSVHANAVASGAAGFMTGADKAKLDGLPGACSTTVWSADSDASSSAHANGIRYVPLRDAESDTLTFQFASARTGTLELAVHYAMSSSSAAGVRLRVDSLALSAGGNPSDALTTGTAFTLTTTNDVLLHQITSSDSGDLNFSVTLADIVIVTITRLGSDGADTHTGDFRIYQVRAT